MDQLKRKLPSWCLLLAVFFTSIIAEESIDVSFEELRVLNASCAPYDTCAGVEANDERYGGYCDCGPGCAVYGTCCIDSPYRGVSRMTKTTRRLTEVCTKVFGSSDSYFMVKECNPKWYGSREVKTLCEQDVETPRDPFVLIPASSIEKKKTYKNFFCGLCNNVDPEELMLWNLTLKLTSKVQEDAVSMAEQLVYDESLMEWGLWEEYGEGTPNFQVVDLIPKAPAYLNLVSRSCIPNLVSECSPSWKDEKIRRKCSSYMAAIYVINPVINRNGTLRYRNVHCAICNYESSKNINFCNIHYPVFGPAMSFTLLLDVNSSDGSKVGKVSKCKAGQSYDPFFKRCRNLECALPGFVLDNNKCVRST